MADSAGAGAAEAGAVPRLRVVRGEADTEEIAALVATLTVLTAARRAAISRRGRTAVQANWNDPARLLRAPRYRSSAGWRRSALP